MTFNFTAQEIERIARESPTFLAIVCRKLVSSESTGVTERLKTRLSYEGKTTKLSQVKAIMEYAMTDRSLIDFCKSIGGEVINTGVEKIGISGAKSIVEKLFPGA